MPFAKNLKLHTKKGTAVKSFERAGSPAATHPLRPRLVDNFALQARFELKSVLARDTRKRVVRKLRAADVLAQLAELAVIAGGDEDLSVRRRKLLIRREVRVRVAHRPQPTARPPVPELVGAAGAPADGARPGG